MRGIKPVIVTFRSFEQVKFDETRHGMKMRIALSPARLESRLFAITHFEAVHRDKHGSDPSPVVAGSASHASPSSSRPPPPVNSDSASCWQTPGQNGRCFRLPTFTQEFLPTPDRGFGHSGA